jgi:hypothetical protein
MTAGAASANGRARGSGIATSAAGGAAASGPSACSMLAAVATSAAGGDAASGPSAGSTLAAAGVGSSLRRSGLDNSPPAYAPNSAPTAKRASKAK